MRSSGAATPGAAPSGNRAASSARYRPVRRVPWDERTAAIHEDLHSAVEQIAQSGRIEQWLHAMATDGLRRRRARRGAHSAGRQRRAAASAGFAASSLQDEAMQQSNPTLAPRASRLDRKELFPWPYRLRNMGSMP